MKYLLALPLLLFLGAAIFTSCRSLPEYTFHYVGLEAYNGDTLLLWRYTADGLKSDKDYGGKPLSSQVVTNGKVTFTGDVDTLHLYYVGGKECGVFFYPEDGEITHSHSGTALYGNNRSVAGRYELLRKKGFPREETRKFIFANLQNAMGVYLLDRIGCYPGEQERIYKNSNPRMRDTVSLLLSMKKQLQETRSVAKGNEYIDFRQKGMGQDSVLFSDYFNKNKTVCLFFANGQSDSFLEKMEEIKKAHADISFVGYAGGSLIDKCLRDMVIDRYHASLFDDKRYDGSVRYKYRVDYRTKINYYLIFDSHGRLIETYIN